MRSHSLKIAGIGAFMLVAITSPKPSTAAPTEVVALVASNAKAAFTEIIKDFQNKHKGVTVKASYLGGAEIGKIVDEQGEADVVLVGSSTTDKEANLLGPTTPVLRNKEIILVPKGNPAKIHALKDLGSLSERPVRRSVNLRAKSYRMAPARMASSSSKPSATT